MGLAVLLQAELLLVQVHRHGVDAGPLQVQTYPLTPLPPGGQGRRELRNGGEGSESTSVY